MDAAYGFAAGKVRDRACDAEDAGVAARGQAHRLAGLGEEFAAGFVKGAMVFEKCAVSLGVGAHPASIVALRLHRACRRDPLSDIHAALSGRRQRQIGGAHPLHVLLHTGAGLACLAVGGVLEGAGLWWALRIVRGAEAA